MKVAVLSLACLAALSGCASAPERPSQTASAAANVVPVTESPLPAHDKLDALLWMQRALEYRILMQGIFRAAQDQLNAALADPAWDALPKGERIGAVQGLPPAVIVDVDETVLDNSPYLARQIVAGKYGFDAESWAAWCAERAALALPGAREFAEFASARGITMIYISNRDLKDLESTSANLASQGFPLVDDSVLLLGAATPGCVAKGSDKGCRRRMAGERHRILMLVGDNLGDFVDGVGADAPTRDALVAPYRDWLGQRWFMLPNPAYGSWESSLTRFPANEALKSDARAAKRDALRVK